MMPANDALLIEQRGRMCPQVAAKGCEAAADSGDRQPTTNATIDLARTLGNNSPAQLSRLTAAAADERRAQNAVIRKNRERRSRLSGMTLGGHNSLQKQDACEAIFRRSLMKFQRLAVVLTLINLVLLIILLAQIRPVGAQGIVPV